MDIEKAKLVLLYDIELQRLFFSVLGKKIYSRYDVYYNKHVIIEKNSEIPKNLCDLHTNLSSVSPKHPDTIDFFTDQAMRLFFLLFPFWVVEGFRYILHKSIAPQLLKSTLNFDSTEFLLLESKNKLLGINDKFTPEVIVPAICFLTSTGNQERPTANVAVFFTKKFMERSFIVYFHSILYKFLYSVVFLEFSEYDESFVLLYESLREIDIILPFDSIVNTFSANKVSFKNLLRPITTSTLFFNFLIDIFFKAIREFPRNKNLIVLEYPESFKQKLHQFKQLQKHSDVFFTEEANESGFLVNITPTTSFFEKKITIENFDLAVDAFTDFIYGEDKIEEALFFYFYTKVREFFILPS